MTTLLIARDSVTRCKLNFQLDNFIPLLVRSVSLWNRKQVTQTATIIVGWRGHCYSGQDFGRGIRIGISHRKLKNGARQSEPRIE